MSATPPPARGSAWGKWVARVRSTDDLYSRTPFPESEQSAAERRRRLIVCVVTAIVGSVALAGLLRMDQTSGWFPLAGIGIALIWAIGALLAGKLHAGWLRVGEELDRPVIQPVITGLVLAGIFVGGAFAVGHIPMLAPVADYVRNVLGYTASAPLIVVAFVTLVNGIAEELFYRGALYQVIPVGHQVWVTTGLYTLATALTGNPMLAFAALLLGLVCGIQRRVTGGVLAPILTHIVWSLTMLFALPAIL